jgi:hypothetical protein
MEETEVLRKLAQIQYHQKLIVSMIHSPNQNFHKLIVENELFEEEVKEFYQLCEKLSIELEEQKAEGFVYFHPLYHMFSTSLNSKLSPTETINACLAQGIFLPLMEEFKNYI